MRKRILVTGGSGFIGSHLCEKLLQLKYNVICLDDLTTGSVDNINHLLRKRGFKFIYGDITSPIKIKVDEIYHLASPTDPASVLQYSYETLLTNTVGTSNLLEIAEKNKSKFLFVSSIKVLGECERVQPYIQGKKTGEFLCKRYEHIGTKVVRLANSYGPRMKITDSRVIPTFITKCLKNEEISLWNGGNQLDSFCYIDDTIDALIKFMESDYAGAIEFGYSSSISIKDLAFLIIEKTKSLSSIRYNEEVFVSEECHKLANIETALKLLNWKPKISLDEGLDKTIQYFKGLM